MLSSGIFLPKNQYVFASDRSRYGPWRRLLFLFSRNIPQTSFGVDLANPVQSRRFERAACLSHSYFRETGRVNDIVSDRFALDVRQSCSARVLCRREGSAAPSRAPRIENVERSRKAQRGKVGCTDRCTVTTDEKLIFLKGFHGRRDGERAAYKVRADVSAGRVNILRRDRVTR